MIRATAPGKLILAGEHAAVYGRPALVAAVDLRTRVDIGSSSGTGVRLELPDVGVDRVTDWQALSDYARAARRAWEAYRDEPNAERFAELTTRDPAHVVTVALAETARAVAAEPRGAVVRVESDVPVGAGFGSSASVAVATIGAASMFLVGQMEPALVDGVALEVERRQHGRPSGADHATVLNGGVQWFERGGGDRLTRRTLAFDRHLLRRLRAFHTGTPVERTGEIVEAVRQRFEDRADELDEILDGMESDVRDLRGVLTSGTEGQRGLVALLSSYERGLEQLGVVPDEVRAVVRRVEASGGAAKISGAGALTGVGAGALLAYSADEEPLLDALAGYDRLDADLGASGLELEMVSG